MSLLTMIMNPDRSKDLSDMMNKLDRWDDRTVIRDYEMKFEKDDISDKMRKEALFAVAPEAVVDWNLKEVSEAPGPLLHKVCRGSAGVKLKAVSKIDGFNAWRVSAFWFQARSTNDSMSLLTMIMNPDSSKDLSDMMNKLDRWDAVIRDYEMSSKRTTSQTKCAKKHCSPWLPAGVENRLAGRRDGQYAKVRSMIDDMIRDKKEARGAIKLSGGGNQPPLDVDQLKLREMTSDFAEESSEGGSDTSSVQKLAESLSVIVETLNSASEGKSKRKGKEGQWAQESSTGGQWQGTSQKQNAAGNRQPWPQPKEAGRAIEKPKGKGKGKGRRGGKAKGKGKGFTCHVRGEIGHSARLCPSEGWVKYLVSSRATV